MYSVLAARCPPPIDWRRPAAEVALDRRCRRRGVRRPIAAPYGAVKLQRKGDRRTITGTPPALRLAGRALDGCGSRAPLAGGRDTSPLRDGKEVGSHVLTSRSGVLQSTRPPRFSVPTDDIDAGTHGDNAGSCVCRLGRADFGAPHLGRHRGTDDTKRETRATTTQETNGQLTAAAPAPERKPKRNCKPKQTDDRTKPPTADQTCGWRRGAYGMLLTG